MFIFATRLDNGGPFYHPTSVKHAATVSMDGRDYLKELLDETSKYGIEVWLSWAAPIKPLPGTDIFGLNNPDLTAHYTQLLEEVARKYGNYRNLAGIVWHELDAAESKDEHRDDLQDFINFAKSNFPDGESYTGQLPIKLDPNDKWWRRYYLYKIHCVNSFVAQMNDAAQLHGLRTDFVFYPPELNMNPWNWGYDIVGLEKYCSHMLGVARGEEILPEHKRNVL